MSSCKVATCVLLSSCRRARTGNPLIIPLNYKNMFHKQTTIKTAPRIWQTWQTYFKSNLRRFSASTSVFKEQEESHKQRRLSEADNLQTSYAKAVSARQKVRSWAFKVSSYGKIIIQTCFDVVVKAVRPLDCPNADQISVRLAFRSNIEIDDYIFEKLTNVLEVAADYKDDQLHLEGWLKNTSLESASRDQELGVSILWHAEVPMSFDVDIQTFSNGTVVLEGLENSMCTIQSEHGNCHIHKVKSGTVKVSSLSGDVICKKILQGNAEIATHRSGSITADRLQGQTFDLTSEAGVISCKDIYAVKSTVKTASGGIELRNVHGECDMASSEGSIQIGSLDGSLKAVTDTGDISTYLVQHKEAMLSSQHGDISVKVPGDIQSKVHLQAPSVTITPELLTQSVVENKLSDGNVVFSGEWNTGTDSKLQATTKGSITVAVQSWLDSLNLNK